MKTRVLHLITCLPVGGAERLFVDIVRGLDRNRYEPVVCCIQKKGELADDLEQSGIRVVCLDRMRSKRFDFRAVLALARLLRSDRIDLLHSHLFHANLYGRIAALLAGVPAVATVHNTYARHKRHRRFLNRVLAHWTARVVAVSDATRADVLKYDKLPPEKVLTIVNGVDLARFDLALSRKDARDRLGIPGDAFVLGCVARLEEQKGHRYLLEAVARLRDDRAIGARLRVLLVGDGRLRRSLEEKAKELGIGGRVSFLGARRDVPEILKSLDLYVMPSLWEGLSIAMLEAMASGLPIVASDVGGVSQVLGDDEHGVKVRPGDSAELAATIVALAHDERRRAALSASARQRAAAFSLQAMLTKLTALYEEALARGPQPQPTR